MDEQRSGVREYCNMVSDALRPRPALRFSLGYQIAGFQPCLALGFVKAESRSFETLVTRPDWTSRVLEERNIP
jgi:hypothetical protein